MQHTKVVQREAKDKIEQDKIIIKKTNNITEEDTYSSRTDSLAQAEFQAS